MRTLARLLLSTFLCLVPGATILADIARALEGKDATPEVGNGMQVSLEYTLKDDKGNLVESNQGKDPLVYRHGGKEILPSLEKALAGLKKGEEKDVKLSAKEGYGEVDAKAFVEVPKEQVPAEAQRVGTVLRAQSPDGKSMPVRVKEVKDKTVLVDFNHPMAGKNLVFHVKVLDVKKSEPKVEAAAPAPAAKPAADTGAKKD